MQSNNQPNPSLSLQTLQRLKQLYSKNGLVFSLFLDLRKSPPADQFNQLLETAMKQRIFDQAPARFQAEWQTEANRISNWIRQNQPLNGQGLALFSCQADNIWQVFVLPVPVQNHLMVKNQPFTRPLEILLAESPNSDLSKMDLQDIQQQELKRVEELISHTNNKELAIFELDNILLAVRPGRVKAVRLLVVDEDLHQQGGECPNCGFLGVDEQVCLICGMALRPESDVVEVALKRVIDAGGDIDILRSQKARQTIKPHGKIGALLRNSRDYPVEKDSANQQPMAKNGKINPDIIHDETIEESFPASDPPGWNA